MNAIAVGLRRNAWVLPALLGALLVNIVLFGLLSLLSRDRDVSQDLIAPSHVRLVTLSPPEPPQEKEIVTRQRPQPRPEMDFTPDLRPPSPDFRSPVFAGDLAIDLDGLNLMRLDAEIVFEASELDQEPATLVRVPPVYPFRARERGIEGEVQVKLLINVDGSIGQVQILGAQPEGLFEDAVRQTVTRWKYRPGRLAGQAVPSWVVTSIRFDLD